MESGTSGLDQQEASSGVHSESMPQTRRCWVNCGHFKLSSENIIKFKPSQLLIADKLGCGLLMSATQSGSRRRRSLFSRIVHSLRSILP